jgi:N-dimethylarginine dimethylaminohydrolase
VGTLARVAVRRPLVGGADVVAQYEAAHWQTPDLDALAVAHAAFVATLRQLGSDVVELDAVPGLPDAMFVYDPVFMAPSGSIALRAAKAARQGEVEQLVADLESAGVPTIGALVGEATADAGDMFWLDESTVAIGRSYRTNEEAVAQLRGILASEGVGVESFDLPHDQGPEFCLHLMSVISPVREDLAVVYERLAPVPLLRALNRRGIEWVVVDDEEYAPLGCNILATAPGVVVLGERNVRIAAQLRERGVEVHTFDSHESDKGEGGPTCLTRPIRRR